VRRVAERRGAPVHRDAAWRVAQRRNAERRVAVRRSARDASRRSALVLPRLASERTTASAPARRVASMCAAPLGSATWRARPRAIHHTTRAYLARARVRAARGIWIGLSIFSKPSPPEISFFPKPIFCAGAPAPLEKNIRRWLRPGARKKLWKTCFFRKFP